MSNTDKTQDEEESPSEIDFSKGVRGKFFRENVQLNIPVYLDREVQKTMEQIAFKKGIQLSDVVNEFLRKDIAHLEKEK